MSEVIYCYNNKCRQRVHEGVIHWLEAQDYSVYNRHLELCQQGRIDRVKWDSMYKEEIRYCGLFIGEYMVARACVEKYSETHWEVADVRVAKAYRNRGYAKAVCEYVLDFILVNNKQATIRTEADNKIMQQAIKSIGFTTIEKVDL